MKIIDVSEAQMRSLKVIDITSLPIALETMERVQLCAHRGLDLRPVAEDKRVFIDNDLGYLIVRRDLIPALAKRFDIDADRLIQNTFDNWRADFVGKETATLAAQANNPWYVATPPGWPVFRGSCVPVAVIDDGTSKRLLRRGEGDFSSCHGLDLPPYSIDGHGESCARTIAEPDSAKGRISPAPDCRIISAQAVRGNGEVHIWFVDLLLMLSWAVGCRGAQIVNMSFKLDTSEIDKDNRQGLLSRIALTLRAQNRALIFAAADNANSIVRYPARLNGITAVGSYTMNETGGFEIQTGTDPSWAAKEIRNELLFAPQGTLIADAEIFTGSSSSCAYASGVAAIFVERYFGQHTLDEIRLKLAVPLNGQSGGAAITVPGIRLHP